MFKASLDEKLQRIFDLGKASFDRPSESQEQECLFIEVDSSMNHVKDGKEIAKVIGKLRVFANADKIPYGYFSKRIQSADPADTKDLFFYDIEKNTGTFRNIAERSMGFIYFYEGQYDPDAGEITELNTTYEES